MITACPTCSCSCWLADASCILANSELTAATLIKAHHVNKANDDVADLIGEACFEELCAALTAAIEAASEANEGVPPAEQVTAFSLLAAKWQAVLGNRHFKAFYSHRVAYHWFEGSSITELKAAGLITTSNTDEEFKNGFRHAEEAQRKRLSTVEATSAGDSRNRFLTYFWTPNANAYTCAPSSCETSCGDAPAGKGVGLTII